LSKRLKDGLTAGGGAVAARARKGNPPELAGDFLFFCGGAKSELAVAAKEARWRESALVAARFFLSGVAGKFFLYIFIFNLITFTKTNFPNAVSSAPFGILSWGGQF